VFSFRFHSANWLSGSLKPKSKSEVAHDYRQALIEQLAQFVFIKLTSSEREMIAAAGAVIGCQCSQ